VLTLVAETHESFASTTLAGFRCDVAPLFPW
jgi:hypothetical protein